MHKGLSRLAVAATILMLLAQVAVVSVAAKSSTAPSTATRSQPVTPLRVKVDPSKIRPSAAGTMATYEEGGLQPTGEAPERQPSADRVAQLQAEAESGLDAPGIDSLSDPIVNQPGTLSNANPPDTTGDVGPNHYIQMNNSAATGGQTVYQVFNKAGADASGGSVRFGGLWPAGQICNSDQGDPIVVYDHLADRWLLSQFANPNHMCIAISQTPNPLNNTWFLYTFNTTVFPDYPKFGVWPDGYYMTSYEFPNLGVYAFDRINMLLGNAATFFKDTITVLGTAAVRDTRILTADLDGAAAPAFGTPNYFVRTVDDQQDPANPTDRLEVYEYSVDWAANTGTFSLAQTITAAAGGLAAFDIMTCNRGGASPANIRDCIPQPDTTATVDALSNRPMAQLKYRILDGTPTMVFNQTIDVAGSINAVLGFTPANEVAGIRWYQLSMPGATWTIGQQGTYAAQPNGATTEAQLLHRWMGSAAIDKFGNLAVGYSIVNDDDTNGQEVYPSLRYTGRSHDDAPNLMGQPEKVILAGGNSQTGGPGLRWGDYSSLSVDPVDDCTFWYTNHVAGQGGTGARPTQIASFRFADCATDLAISKTVSPAHPNAGEEIVYTITVSNNGSLAAQNVVVTDTLPAQVSYLANTDSCTGVAVGSTGTLTCPLGNLAAGASTSFQIKVKIDADLGGATSITNTATVTSDAGDSNDSNNTVSLTHLVNELADLSVTKLCKPDTSPAEAGSEGICTILVTNNGPSAARSVQLTDTHASDGAFSITGGTTSQGSCTFAAPTTSCNLGTIQPGETATVEVFITSPDGVDVNDVARVTSATPDPNSANNEARAGLSFSASADLSITKTGPTEVNLGDSFSYTLEVNNAGPSTARNVVVTDTLPAGVEFVSATPSTGSVNVVNNVLTWNVGNLASGAGASLTIDVKVLPTTPATLLNNASVTSTTSDPNTANNQATWTTTVIGTDLWIEKQGIVSAQNPSGALIYKITVYNKAGSAPDDTPTSGNGGPNAAINVVVTDPLPLDNKKLVVQFLSPGCTYVKSSHTVTCTTASLAAGTSVTFEIQMQIKGSVGSITNVATVTSDTFDPDLGNNSDTVNNVIQGSTGKGPKPK